MKVTIISTHPDDEALGCAGTLLKHRARGDEVRWCIVTGAWAPKWSSEQIAAKQLEVDRAAAHYGVADLLWPRLDSTRLDTMPLADVAEAIAPAFSSPADTVYLTSPHDTHSDHRVVFDACWMLMKPFRTASDGPKRILVYETLSSTDAAPPFPHRAFQPNVWSDITPWIDAKCEAMKIYASEEQDDLLPRGRSAILALARVRGAQVGVQYAEAFHLLRDFM